MCSQISQFTFTLIITKKKSYTSIFKESKKQQQKLAFIGNELKDMKETCERVSISGSDNSTTVC